MQKRRVFIAINLPEEVKGSLATYQKKWPELPVRWTKLENLHITLDFLGYIIDEELVEVCKNTKEFADKHNSFEVKLSKICYGPPGKSPRMIWVVGDMIKEFNLVPHITLARIKRWEWQRIEPEEKPEIDEDINIKFRVDSIEVMESVLKRGGPEYKELSSFKLK